MYKLTLTALTYLSVTLLLSACALTPADTRDTSVLKDINQVAAESNTPPPAQPIDPDLAKALLPPLLTTPDSTGVKTEERFDVYVDHLNARDFFMGLVQGTSINMVVHPDVSGDITLSLKDVSIDEVLKITRDMFGYPYKKTGNVYQVMAAGLRSEVFHINYLNLTRRGVSDTRVTNGQVSSIGATNNSNNSGSNNNENNGSNQSTQAVTGTQIYTTTDADFWTELKNSLAVLIGNSEGRQVVVTPQAGIVAVRATTEQLELVRSYLEKAELIMRRQVILEAKILEVALNDGYQSGINWAALGRPGSDNQVNFGVSSNPTTSTSGLFSISYDLGDFLGVVELLKTQGSVQVLSSPRISTVNNQKAVIKVGTDEFFVTEVSNTTTTSTGTTTNNPQVELTPFFSGIALDVTPQINDSDEVILHIHPSISEVKDQTKVITLGSEQVELPLALSTIRETDSVVGAKSGQVIVLGGLMQNRASDANSGAPGLRKLPLLGHLFSSQQNSSSKSELVILLKPTIVDIRQSTQGLEGASQRFLKFADELK